MKQRVILLGLLFGILAQTTGVIADPILKPRKYHGPIPRSTFALRVGFLGGADSEEMIDFLDRRIIKPNEAFSEDFGNGLMFDGTYMYKLHPQFAVRANVSASFLRSSGDGFYVPPRRPSDPDTLATVNYTRDFDVDLFILEASAVYFMSDAAVSEFQPYIGGGFSFGVPHAKYKETLVVRDLGGESEPNYAVGQVYDEFDANEWSTEAGVHGVLGALYYFNSTFAISLEGRGQIMQSKFPLTVTNEVGARESVKFDINYSGFTLSVGAVYSF